MPFPRKKIKIVDEDESGKSRAKWVRPKEADPQCYHESSSQRELAEGQHQAEERVSIDPETLHESDGLGNFLDKASESKPSSNKYRDMKGKDIANWKLIRDSIQRVAVENEAPPPNLENCLRCSLNFQLSRREDSHESSYLFRCKDCGPHYFVCRQCLIDDHFLRPAHWPQRWDGERYVNIQLHNYENPLKIPAAVHSCQTQYKRCIKIVDIQGRVQDAFVTFCSCEKEALTLFRLGFWASSSIKPSTAYSTELLKTTKALMLECHVSLFGMANSMRWRNGLSKTQATSIYRLLVNESFEEYRHFHYRYETFRFICPEVDDGATCMVCPKENGKIVLMLDGTFGCVRKQSSGFSMEPPKHGERFFVDDSSVDQFVDQHCQNTKDIRMDCSNFRAGADSLRSKLQYKKLDITGVFGCSCKHDIPGCFLNMKNGERLGYPVYILQAFLEKFENSNVSFGILYDISCLLAKHLKKNKLDVKFQSCTFATPDWHAYGHVASCQIQFAVRFLSDFGITDGEGVERLWSYLRQFTAITKEMTPSHRIDLLTDGLIHFAQRKNASLEYSLVERYQKADKILLSSTEELNRLMKEAKGHGQEWRELYIAKLIALSTAKDELPLCTTIDQIKQVRQHMKETDQELKKIETKNGLSNRWTTKSVDFQHTLKIIEDQKKSSLLISARSQAAERIFHLDLKKKYSCGQDIPKRIEAMIKKASKKLTETVEKYNSSVFSSISSMPNTVTFQDLKDPEGLIYEAVNVDLQLPCSLSPSIRRKATSLYFLKQRACKEKQIVPVEAKRLLQVVEDRIRKVDQRIKDLSVREDMRPLHLGSICILLNHVCSLKARVNQAKQIFSKIIEEKHPPFEDVNAKPCTPVQPTRDSTEASYDDELLDIFLEGVDDDLSDIE
eukprot:gene2632-828_t